MKVAMPNRCPFVVAAPTGNSDVCQQMFA